MAEQKIKFGTKEISLNAEGKRFEELPQILETAYDDVELPSDCEFVADGVVAQGSDVIGSAVRDIEIRAVAGKKALN